MSSTSPFHWDANAWIESIVTMLGLQDKLAKPPTSGQRLWHYTTIDGFKKT
jgi:hypothetical protein